MGSFRQVADRIKGIQGCLFKVRFLKRRQLYQSGTAVYKLRVCYRQN